MPNYDEDEKRPFNLKVWLKLGPFLRPYRYRILFAIILLQLVCAAIDICYPLFQTYAIKTCSFRC